MDEDKLNEMLGRFVADLGATISAGNVVIGDRLGLYRALADGPVTPDEVASPHEPGRPRYVREWLPGQAAGGYVSHDAGRYWLSPAQATAFADPDGPVSRRVRARSRVRSPTRPDRGGLQDRAGVGWDDHDARFHRLRAFYRPGYVATWSAPGSRR